MRRQFSYRDLNVYVCGGRSVRLGYFGTSDDRAFKIVPRTGGNQCVVELHHDGEVVARGVGKDLNLAADLVCQQVMELARA